MALHHRVIGRFSPLQLVELASSQSRVHSVRLAVTQTRLLQQDAKTENLTGKYDHDLQKLKTVMVASKTVNYETLRVTEIPAPNTGVIKVVQLQREKAKNAISRQLLQELSQQVEDIHAEPNAGQTRALVLGSALDDVYCAGADLKERRGMSEQEVQEFLKNLRHTFTRLSTLPIPTIASVSGMALGGGLELALCCHLRIFSSNAVVGLPETRLAIIPGAGGTYRLPQAIGLSRARELILTGRRIQALESAAIGLCHRLVAVDSEEEVLHRNVKNQLALLASIAMAGEIASGGPVAIRAAISALGGQSEVAENAAYDKVLQTKDRVEALQAFAEKRAPQFNGE